MKSIQILIILTLILCIVQLGNAQQLNHTVKGKNGKEKLLGKINQKGLQQDSFATWFIPQYEMYEVDETTTSTIKKELKNYTVKLFMGTWCGDSKREVPRFLKILDKIDFPKENLTMIAVDHVKPNYKKSPGGEEKGLNIIKVPTFILFKNGKEINRIIEYPVQTLEKDLEAIVTGKPYIPHYSDMPVLPVD